MLPASVYIFNGFQSASPSSSGARKPKISQHFRRVPQDFHVILAPVMRLDEPFVRIYQGQSWRLAIDTLAREEILELFCQPVSVSDD